MIGPYGTEEEMIEAILYWQKRALAAEKQVEDECDAYEYMVDTALELKNARDYYKQQFLDKDKEMRVTIQHLTHRLKDSEDAAKLFAETSNALKERVDKLKIGIRYLKGELR